MAMNQLYPKTVHSEEATEVAIQDFSQVMSNAGGVFVGRIGGSDFEAAAFAQSPWRHRAMLPRMVWGKVTLAPKRTPYAHLTLRGHEKRARELNGFFTTSRKPHDFREYLEILDSAYRSTRYFTYATKTLHEMFLGSSNRPAFSHYATSVTSGKTLWNYSFIESLRPFVASMDSWFANKRVLVVTPFAESVKAQFARREELHSKGILLPAAELTTYETPITYSSLKRIYEKPRFARTESWIAELELMDRELSSLDFDVALLGCSSYGMALGPRLEAAGKKAVYIGGAVNLLFNIFGSRFASAGYESLLNLDSRIEPLEQSKYSSISNGREFRNEAMNAYFRSNGK